VPVDCYEPCLLRVRSTSDDAALDSHADLIEMEHIFEFDDPDSGDWARGAGARAGSPSPRNVEASFVAGHVYENPTFDDDCGDGPGTCDKRSPRLDVQSPSGVGSAVATDLVQMKDIDLQWDPSAHEVVCLNPGGDGDFAACPSVDPADHVEVGVSEGADDLDDALAAWGCLDQERRCLLKAGGSFAMGDGVVYAGTARRILGKYGTGADPVVSCTDIPPGACFSFASGNSRIILTDLDFVGNDVEFLTLMGHFGVPGATNVLILRVDGRDFNNCFHFHNSSLPVFADLANHNSMVWIVDSSCLDGPGKGGTDLFIAGGNSGLLGNAIGDRGAEPFDEEHNVRIKRWYRSIASHNSLGLLNDSPSFDGCGETRHPLTLRSSFSHVASTSEDPEWMAVDPRDFDSKEFVLSDNAIQACRHNSNQFHVGPTDFSKCGAGIQDYVVDGNYCWNGYNDFASPKCFLLSGHWFRVSNNVAQFSSDAGGATSQPRGIQIQDRRTGSDVRCDPDLTSICTQEDLDAQPNPGSFISNVHLRDNAVYFLSTLEAENGVAYCIDGDADTVTFQDNASSDGAARHLLLENHGTNVTGCADGLPGTCNIVTSTICDDGLDDDGDGLIDAVDPGCADWLDNDETSPLLPCDNGLDDDLDGGIDLALATYLDPGQGTGDPGCEPGSLTESPECQDGVNNDPEDDDLIDHDGGQSIHGPCADGVCPPGVSDPDGDGVADPDPHCANSFASSETQAVRADRCGLGFEITLLLAPLLWHRRRRVRVLPGSRPAGPSISSG
jgi:hypothetical protein